MLYYTNIAEILRNLFFRQSVPVYTDDKYQLFRFWKFSDFENFHILKIFQIFKIFSKKIIKITIIGQRKVLTFRCQKLVFVLYFLWFGTRTLLSFSFVLWSSQMVLNQFLYSILSRHHLHEWLIFQLFLLNSTPINFVLICIWLTIKISFTLNLYIYTSII